MNITTTNLLSINKGTASNATWQSWLQLISNSSRLILARLTKFHYLAVSKSLLSIIRTFSLSYVPFISFSFSLSLSYAPSITFSFFWLHPHLQKRLSIWRKCKSPSMLCRTLHLPVFIGLPIFSCRWWEIYIEPSSTTYAKYFTPVCLFWLITAASEWSCFRIFSMRWSLW